MVSITCLKIIMETIFSNMKKNSWEEWHYFRLLQVSFMSGNIREAGFSHVLLRSVYYSMVLGAEVDEETLAWHKPVVGKGSIFSAFSVIVDIFLWHYTKTRQVTGSCLKSAVMWNLKLCQWLFVFCYMKINRSLYSLHFAWLFLPCMALCHHASVTWKILVHWDLYPRENENEKTTAAAAAKSLQSCPTLCDPIDGSPPGSPVPGIL